MQSGFSPHSLAHILAYSSSIFVPLVVAMTSPATKRKLGVGGYSIQSCCCCFFVSIGCLFFCPSSKAGIVIIIILFKNRLLAPRRFLYPITEARLLKHDRAWEVPLAFIITAHPIICEQDVARNILCWKKRKKKVSRDFFPPERGPSSILLYPQSGLGLINRVIVKPNRVLVTTV